MLKFTTVSPQLTVGVLTPANPGQYRGNAIRRAQKRTLAVGYAMARLQAAVPNLSGQALWVAGSLLAYRMASGGAFIPGGSGVRRWYGMQQVKMAGRFPHLGMDPENCKYCDEKYAADWYNSCKPVSLGKWAIAIGAVTPAHPGDGVVNLHMSAWAAYGELGFPVPYL